MFVWFQLQGTCAIPFRHFSTMKDPHLQGVVPPNHGTSKHHVSFGGYPLLGRLEHLFWITHYDGFSLLPWFRKPSPSPTASFHTYIYLGLSPLPSNSGIWRFSLGYHKCNNPGGDYSWEQEHPKPINPYIISISNFTKDMFVYSTISPHNSTQPINLQGGAPYPAINETITPVRVISPQWQYPSIRPFIWVVIPLRNW